MSPGAEAYATMAHADYYDENTRPRTNNIPTDYEPPLSRQRSRAPTDESQPALTQSNLRPPPSKDAPNNTADIISPAASQVSPELVAQITEKVLQNLALSGITTSAPAPPLQPIFEPPKSAAQIIPPRNVYTPPSPDRYGATNFLPIPTDIKDYRLDEQPDRGFQFENMPVYDRPATPPAVNNMDPVRPKPPQRLSTGDATTLEKVWQPLFDAAGQHTTRFGQFLRGLATHIIEEFEPRHSLVITPQKMMKFYDTVKLPDEIYPWFSVFGGQMSNSSISHLYRDLKCAHHFVQIGLDDRPSVPALTPEGFECWMSQVIRAHPDEEFARFSTAVLTMPISNADNMKERFPKELSRRLFPKDPDPKVALELADAIYADPVVELSNVTSRASQPAPVSSISDSQANAKLPSPVKMQPPPVPTASDILRKLPLQSPVETIAADVLPPVAIERERKPYYAQAGGGKLYDDDISKADGPPKRANSINKGSRHHNQQDDYPTSTTTRRTGSQAPATATAPSSYNISVGSTSTAPPQGHYRRRNRSPSISAQTNPYTKSSDGITSDYSAYSTTSGSGNGGGVTDGEDDERRRYKVRYAADDNEPRSYAQNSATRAYATEDRNGRGRRQSVQIGNSSSGVGSYVPTYSTPRYT